MKHWAFNDPFRREGAYVDEPPSPEEYRKLATRVVELHPINPFPKRTYFRGWERHHGSATGDYGRPARNLAGGTGLHLAGGHARQPAGATPYCLDDFKGIADSAVPMSLLVEHPNVRFNYYRGGLGACSVEMH